MKRTYKTLLGLLFLVLVYACTDKFNISEVKIGEPKQNNIGDTLYIQQNPVWEGFNQPKDLLIGREPFIYVADTENNRIVMMDIAGRILGFKEIRRPTVLAQDYQLNLIVCGELVDPNNTVFSAVFKIHMVDAHHNIALAKVDTLLPKTSFDYLKPLRKYTGICVFSDNSFYVSRTGPNNNNLIDPDNSVLYFKKKVKSDGTKIDTLIGRVPLLEPLGTGLLSANNISSLTSFKNTSRDVIITLTGNNSFKVQWLQYVVSNEFEGYRSKLAPFHSTLLSVNKFGKPEGVALDNSNNIFVADAEKDSIFKFDSFGEELQSFGGSNLLKNPHAVQYFNKTLYVLDTGNNRIVRFILSTDLN